MKIKRERVERVAPCYHPQFFLIFTMQKRWKWKRISAKKGGRDYVNLIGAYEFNGIEPWAQILKNAILRKCFAISKKNSLFFGNVNTIIF